MSCGPPCPPCAPCPPPPCPQQCAAPPPPPECRPKPVMRSLHWAQTRSHMGLAFVLAGIGSVLYYAFIHCPRVAAYKYYYSQAEFEDQAEDMAKMGLFQAVPKGGFKSED